MNHLICTASWWNFIYQKKITTGIWTNDPNFWIVTLPRCCRTILVTWAWPSIYFSDTLLKVFHLLVPQLRSHKRSVSDSSTFELNNNKKKLEHISQAVVYWLFRNRKMPVLRPATDKEGKSPTAASFLTLDTAG